MIDRPVRVGLQIHPQHAEYAAIRRTVAAAEESGADVVFNWDHFYPLYGDLDGKHFECWTMLGAWAEQTSQIEIGALVTCNSYRNPDLLGDMARTVDHLSGGRLVLGVGAGWFEKDYRNFGYDFGTPGTRLAALEDALPRIDTRLAAGNPPPTRKVPLLIGGGGERKTLRLVARHADIWHTFGDAATIAHKRAVLEDWCAKERRDPAEIELSCGVDTEGDNARPEVLGEQLHAVGTRLFTVGVTGPDFDLGALQKWVAWRDEHKAKVLPPRRMWASNPRPPHPMARRRVDEPTRLAPGRETLRRNARRRRRMPFAAVHASQCAPEPRPNAVGGSLGTRPDRHRSRRERRRT
jgi:probable F420-dependent oxidoreductase